MYLFLVLLHSNLAACCVNGALTINDSNSSIIFDSLSAFSEAICSVKSSILIGLRPDRSTMAHKVHVRLKCI